MMIGDSLNGSNRQKEGAMIQSYYSIYFEMKKNEF